MVLHEARGSPPAVDLRLLEVSSNQRPSEWHFAAARLMGRRDYFKLHLASTGPRTDPAQTLHGSTTRVVSSSIRSRHDRGSAAKPTDAFVTFQACLTESRDLFRFPDDLAVFLSLNHFTVIADTCLALQMRRSRQASPMIPV